MVLCSTFGCKLTFENLYQPENILCHEVRGVLKLKLADWGFAQVVLVCECVYVCLCVCVCVCVYIYTLHIYVYTYK